MTRGFMLACLLLLVGCGTNDNDIIRRSADDKFKYTGWTLDDTDGEDDAELRFTNMRTRKEMKWAGDVGDALTYLDQIDVGKCYFNPIDKGQAQEVDCE